MAYRRRKCGEMAWRENNILANAKYHESEMAKAAKKYQWLAWQQKLAWPERGGGISHRHRGSIGVAVARYRSIAQYWLRRNKW
jgi:hypothetical protein